MNSSGGYGAEIPFDFPTARGTGKFVQDVAYQPYGETKSSGARPGDALYADHPAHGLDDERLRVRDERSGEPRGPERDGIHQRRD